MTKWRTDSVDSATIRRLAVAADVDPRSVVRVLHGERVRGMPDTRIRKALADSGINISAPAANGGNRAA